MWIWIVFLLFCYLAFGNLTAKFVVMDFNDPRGAKELPFYRRILRLLVFPFRYYEWEKRTSDSEILIMVKQGGFESNKDYIALHTFIWPTLRIFPALAAVFWMIVCLIIISIRKTLEAIFFFFDILFSKVFPKSLT